MKNQLGIAALFLLLLGNAYAQDNTKTLGQKDPLLVSLKGLVFALPDSTTMYVPAIEKQKPIGTIYAQKLDVPDRDFTEGFPGVTDRFEWFGMIYTGVFEIEKAGAYIFTNSSDDGSILWIDGKVVVSNDGVHGSSAVDGEVTLTAGLHQMKVWYFQGPATQIAMQLFVREPGEPEENRKIFDLNNYSKSLKAAAANNKAIITPEGIKVRFDNVLFDTGKADLKPEADATLNAIADILKFYPTSTVRIEGHTDIIGDPKANQVLSEDRAKSVMNALKKLNISPEIVFKPKGYGSTRPIVTGNTENGNAQNRRVEVFILP
ncbi:MAG: OmpA family protein [Spirosomataceae bacterium]